MVNRILRLFQCFTLGMIYHLLLVFPSFAFCQNRDDSINVLHYAIQLEKIDIPSAKIGGHTTIKLVSNYNSVNHLQFELLKLTVDSVLVQGVAHPFSYNDTLIELHLSTALRLHDTITVVTYYQGSPHVESSGWGGFHFSGKNLAYNLGIALNEIPHNFGRVWYPCVDNFTERASYDFYIKVDSSLMAVCNGMLISTATGPGPTKTYHWELKEEIPAYLASVAVSDYAEVHGLYDGQKSAIPTVFYVTPDDTSLAKGSFLHLNSVLAGFERRFGPYRWPKVGFVSTSIGAMEHATIIAYPSGSINGRLTDESLYAHELSHAWFGNLITCQTAADMWINEGWAVFSESVMMEEVYGTEAYKNDIRKKLHDVLRNAQYSDEGYHALYNPPEKHTYGSTTYDKGGVVVASLRGFLGDSVFFGTVRAMLDSFAFKSISTYQMLEFFNTHSGSKLDDFFEAWVFSPGFPHFSVSSFAVKQLGKEFEVTLQMRQRLKGATKPANSNRIEIGFYGNAWQHTVKTMKFSGLSGTQTFLLPFAPVLAMADPEGKLGDASVDYQAILKTTGKHDFPDTYFSMNISSIRDSALVRVIHNWIAPDSMLHGIPGLCLSNTRYWKVEGLFPAGFTARADFAYDSYPGLEFDLLSESTENVVLLYRPNSASQWQRTNCIRIGNQEQGVLSLEKLQAGEYTLAIPCRKSE